MHHYVTRKGVVFIVCLRGLLFTIYFFENDIKSHFPCIFLLSVNFHYPEMKIEFKKYLKIRSFPVISGNFRKMTRKNAIFYPLKKPWGIKDSP